MKPTVNIVWFKRDLRLSDHEPLARAIEAGKPLILLYIFEPLLLQDPHFSERHWRFVWQSLQDMNLALLAHGAKVSVSYLSALETFQLITKQYTIEQVFSHQEVGLDNTFKRDKHLTQVFKQQGIVWHETPLGAVIRGSATRIGWDKNWQQVMRAEQAKVDLALMQNLSIAFDDKSHAAWQQVDDHFQRGGSSMAWQTLESFYQGRGQQYHALISKPLASQQSCSRLSPYLAWGNLSLRQAYQTLLSHWQRSGWRRPLQALSSRLHWHCHFIQKFESEAEMEFRPVNKGYLNYQYDSSTDAMMWLAAWKQGNTGYPMVDACMRCLHQTGYINFRMRAMLVSFLCHHLNIDWREGTAHLASLFLDFEPGIHYAQFQMQAGVTGTNTLRIYNPVKQSQEHDPNGVFLEQWCPELSELPSALKHEPWLVTPMEEALYNFALDRDYPAPIINLSEAAKNARERLWAFRASPAVKRDKARILATHVRPSK